MSHGKLSNTFQQGGRELWAPHALSREEKQRNLVQEHQSSTYNKKQLLGDNWEMHFLRVSLEKKKSKATPVSGFDNNLEPAGCSGTGNWAPCTKPSMTQNSFVSVYLHKNFPQKFRGSQTSLPNSAAQLTVPISPPPKSLVMFAKCPLLANSNAGFQVRPCR